MATAIEALPHGMHEGIDEDVYHQSALGMASVSALLLFADTPSKYIASIRGERPRVTTPALSFGTAVHCALNEPERFSATYLIEPYFGPTRANAALGVSKDEGKANKERRDAWRKAHEGAILLDSKDGQRTLGMIARIAEQRDCDPPAADLFREGVSEVTLRWRCPITGLECRARDDYYQEPLAIAADYKTCQDASEEGFAKAAAEYKFHWIEAFYRAGHRALRKDLQDYIFVMQEKEIPYDFGVYRLPPDDVLEGIAEVESTMSHLADCLKRDVWPGYSNEIRTVARKRWGKKVT
jgi:hypothetical protein